MANDVEGERPSLVLCLINSDSFKYRSKMRPRQDRTFCTTPQQKATAWPENARKSLRNKGFSATSTPADGGKIKFPPDSNRAPLTPRFSAMQMRQNRSKRKEYEQTNYPDEPVSFSKTPQVGCEQAQRSSGNFAISLPLVAARCRNCAALVHGLQKLTAPTGLRPSLHWRCPAVSV